MKKKILLILTAVILITSCSSTPKEATPAPVENISTEKTSRTITMSSFSDGQGIEWKLIEVHIESEFSKDMLFDRNELINEGFGDLYTLIYDGETFSGAGSPNRYTSPYTLGDDQTISLMPMRSTLMASIQQQPEKLPEHHFYFYMQNIYEWKSENEHLVFLSKTEDGQDVRLVFGQND
jgi:heat shock protein HslJ